MLFNKFLDWLFPPKCILCGKIINENTDYFCCDNCEKEYLFKIICCSKCSGVMTECEKPVCYTCKAAKRSFDGAVSASRYTEAMRKAVHRYKFRPEPYMAKTLAQFVSYAFIKSGAKSDAFDILLCVPPDKIRYRNRGFDHAALIGRAAAEKLDIPYMDNVILKVKKNKPQHTLNARQRDKNVRGAYKIINPDAVKDKNILLVDDVFTTGSTVNEIARILKRAGAKYVLVATACKAVPKI